MQKGKSKRNGRIVCMLLAFLFCLTSVFGVAPSVSAKADEEEEELQFDEDCFVEVEMEEGYYYSYTGEAIIPEYTLILDDGESKTRISEAYYDLEFLHVIDAETTETVASCVDPGEYQMVFKLKDK